MAEASVVECKYQVQQSFLSQNAALLRFEPSNNQFSCADLSASKMPDWSGAEVMAN